MAGLHAAYRDCQVLLSSGSIGRPLTRWAATAVRSTAFTTATKCRFGLIAHVRGEGPTARRGGGEAAARGEGGLKKKQ